MKWDNKKCKYGDKYFLMLKFNLKIRGENTIYKDMTQASDILETY